LSDGKKSLDYDPLTNHVTSVGYAYDAAGNQVRSVRADGLWQSYRYDAAGRLVKVLDEASGLTVEIHVYGADNRRLVTQTGEPSNKRRYYVWSGDKVIAEYDEPFLFQTSDPNWTKSRVHLGERLLSTVTGSGSNRATRFHHPDRLGTRFMSSTSSANVQEVAPLPYGAALDPWSGAATATDWQFTSYDRSTSTLLDYASNRFYDSQQGRFIQGDPLGFEAVDPGRPQSTNLYGYVSGDPVNRVDSAGLKQQEDVRICGWVITEFGATVACIVETHVSDPPGNMLPGESGRGGGGGGRGSATDRIVNAIEELKTRDAIDKRLAEQLRRLNRCAEIRRERTQKHEDAAKRLREGVESADTYVGWANSFLQKFFGVEYGPVAAVYMGATQILAPEIVTLSNFPEVARQIDQGTCPSPYQWPHR
jgi:RHS repeat-associated protein